MLKLNPNSLKQSKKANDRANLGCGLGVLVLIVAMFVIGNIHDTITKIVAVLIVIAFIIGDIALFKVNNKKAEPYKKALDIKEKQQAKKK